MVTDGAVGADKNPREKISVRQPDPMKKVERLESMVTEKKQAESPVSEPAPQQHPAEIPTAWLAVLASPGLHRNGGKYLGLVKHCYSSTWSDTHLEGQKLYITVTT